MEVSFNNSDTGCCDNLFSRIRKYCKLTQNWTGKIVNVCFHLGLQLKNVSTRNARIVYINFDIN